MNPYAPAYWNAGRFSLTSPTTRQAWLADVLARINDHNIQKLDRLLPGTGRPPPTRPPPESCSPSQQPAVIRDLDRTDTDQHKLRRLQRQRSTRFYGNV